MLLQTIKKKPNSLIKKWAKNINRYFMEKEIHLNI